MPAIFPVGTQRISDLLLQKRLLSQFQYDRTELVKLQDQLSTGYRISSPSEDAPAALRAIALQRLLEQKDQAKINLSSGRTYVSATDDALQGVADLLIGIRSEALAAVDSTSTAQQRQALGEEVQRVIERLVQVGNREFNGRYLFAGSTAGQQPFEFDGPYVTYLGNEGQLSSYVDVGFLTATNLTGEDVFGALSPEVRGTVVMTPTVTSATRLEDLRGGAGIRGTSLVVSDGNSRRTIDFAGAATLGDIVRILQANPPEGRQLTVRLTATGLSLDLDDAGGGNLTVEEVAGGSTAADLGILEPDGTGVAPLVGDDLTPRLRGTTPLQDCFGSRAQGVLAASGPHNDLVIEASRNGAEFNGVQVEFVAGAAVGDQALVHYDPVAKKLQIDIRPGATTTLTVVEAVNATGLFTAWLDPQLDAENEGSGLADVTATAILDGGSGIVFDQDSGIQLVNRGETYTLRFTDAQTVEDLLNALNHSGAGVLASINSAGTGIDVRSRVSGADFAIGENGGSTAAELGIRTFSRETRLSELNHGLGVGDATGTDFVVRRRDGQLLEIDIASAQTVGDVLDLINQHPANVGATVVARLAEFGNGIELLDANAAGGTSLAVLRRSGSAAWDLGLVPRGAQEAAAETVVTPAGPAEILGGSDVGSLETQGVFNSLIRLQTALEQADLQEIERTVAALDEDFDRVNFARSDLGARGRFLDALSERLDNEEVELRQALSQEIDVDMVEVISDLAARQASLEATLRLVGRTLQLTLLNFL